MTLHQMTDAALLIRFEKLVRTERKITHLVLECIAEIDRRKIYLDKAYPSLFEYLTEAFGYSAGAAQRRISSARLLREVPEVAQKIEQGKINLSQVALVAQTIKVSERRFGERMDLESKLELLEKLEAKSIFETQQILAQELKVEVAPAEKTQHHADGSVTLSITLTSEQHKDWARAGELVAHAVPTLKSSDLLHYLAKKEIARRTEIRRPVRTSVTEASSRVCAHKSAAAETSFAKDQFKALVRLGMESCAKPFVNPRQIQPRVRKQILRERSCEYRDPQSGRICGSRSYLQIDHRIPVSEGGTRHTANLRALCGAHNRHVFANH